MAVQVQANLLGSYVSLLAWESRPALIDSGLYSCVEDIVDHHHRRKRQLSRKMDQTRKVRARR